MSQDGDEAHLSRREFVQVGITSLLALTASTLQQADVDLTDAATDEAAFQGVADLLGPEAARPAPDSSFFDDKPYFAYRYEATDTGRRYFITQDGTNWTEIPMTIPTNQLEEVQTQNDISFFNHTFARPNVPDTKNWSFTAADVSKQASEVELMASSTILESSQRGNYPPGSEATAGVAFRLTDTPTAGSGFGGYFDANNGVLVGEDATDSFVELRKGGTSKKVYRTDWNGHVPDSRVWESNRPVITRFPHLFYGGGDIEVNALLHKDNRSELRELHRFTPSNVDDTFGAGPPLDQPNLPARFETSSLSGANVRANAAHYQFSLSESEQRVNGEHFGETTVGTSGWTELLTWQKRPNWEMVNVKPLKISVAAQTNPVRLQLHLNPSMSSTSTALPTDTSTSETAVEIVDGTINTDGERRWVGFVPAGQGQKSDALAAEGLTFNLPSRQSVALFGQAVGGDATVNGVVAWEEFF